MHPVSRTVDSITLSWSQPDQPNGVILDYELQYYEKVPVLLGPLPTSTPLGLRFYPPPRLDALVQQKEHWPQSQAAWLNSDSSPPQLGDLRQVP